jgi:Fe-S cluster assembly protein SufD
MAITVAEDKFADIKEWFASLFEVQERALNGQKGRPLHDMRRRAIERLPELNFPTRRDENWKYTSVTRMLKPQYKLPAAAPVDVGQVTPFTYAGLDTHQLVFINGIFDEALSQVKDLPDGVVIKNLEAAYQEAPFREMIDEHLRKWIGASDDPFLNLNAAFAASGIFIHIPKNVVVEHPVHLLHLAQPGGEPLLISPQCLVVAGQSSDVTLLESYHVLPGEASAPYFTNVVNRMIIQPNGRIRHYKLQQAHEESFMVHHTTVDQERDSTYTDFTADLGGRLVRNNLHTLLQSESTMTNMYGVFLGDGNQHIDNQTFIDHAYPHCQSNELYKGILTDRARGVFNGQVMVRQDAQKTNAFQQNSTLVLSDNAQMDSKPQLEIYADDVRCSHGATIGQLEEEAVFYLRTRGLTDKQARSMLQHAFIREVIDFVAIDEVKNAIDARIEEKFAGQWG